MVKPGLLNTLSNIYVMNNNSNLYNINSITFTGTMHFVLFTYDDFPLTKFTVQPDTVNNDHELTIV